MLSHLLLGLALTVAQPPPSEQGPAEPPTEPAPPAAESAPVSERWALMKVLQGTYPGWLLDSHRVQISGWTDMSFTASSLSGNLLPYGFNYRGNEFLLQQNWLRIDCPVNTTAAEPTFGFRSDTMLPGTDYRFTLARGLFSGQLTASNGQPNLYGIDPIEFYVEGYFPTVCRGLDVKIGHFFTQFGTETNDAPSNALGSRSYTFVWDPFTQTGVLATLKLSDAWIAQVGLVLGSDVFIDPAAEPTGIASIKWAPPDGRQSVLFSVIVGSGRFNEQRNFHNPEIFDFIYTRKIDSRLSYTFESLYGCTRDVPNIGFANWLGVLNYLTYEFTPKLSGTTRLEFFDDFQGQRTAFPGLYTALTAGVSIKLRRDVIFRPELRYDYNGESAPFQNHHGLFTATADLLLRW
jgi:hypothetical protein